MISVIVPVYNVEATISKTLDSILAQTYSSIEIIVVNDGSTDKSTYIVNQYGEMYENIRVIHTENKGVMSARLTGVKVALGEWIGFVDGDDQIDTDMYEFLINNADCYNADISHCGYRMIFADKTVSYFHNSKQMILQDTTRGLQDLLEGSSVEPGLCNKMYKKSLFDDSLFDELYNSNIKINEDLLMNYILFSKAKRSVFYDECKYQYIVRNNSASRAELNPNKIYDPIKVKQLIIDMNISGMDCIARRAYVGTCLNVYNCIIRENSIQFLNDKKQVYKLISEHKSWIGLVKNKYKMLLHLIISCPHLYKYMYLFCAKFVQKSRYEHGEYQE